MNWESWLRAKKSRIPDIKSFGFRNFWGVNISTLWSNSDIHSRITRSMRVSPTRHSLTNNSPLEFLSPQSFSQCRTASSSQKVSSPRARQIKFHRNDLKGILVYSPCKPMNFEHEETASAGEHVSQNGTRIQISIQISTSAYNHSRTLGQARA